MRACRPPISRRSSSRPAGHLGGHAWLYAFTFFMAAFFPADPVSRRAGILFARAVNWVPGVISIAVAVSVALAMRIATACGVARRLALVFEVVSSYGIAAAEFLQPLGLVGESLDRPVLGRRVDVAVQRRRADGAALRRHRRAAVGHVGPAMVLLSISMFPPASRPTGMMVFFAFGFPYLLVVIMAYVGARVVYNLGTEVTRARELGSYRLEDRLGEGGMGEVWRASHRLLARPAAIKLIRSSGPGNGAGSSDDMRRRFEREAQVIAQLRSPHTVTLFDFGVAEEGSFYYVMELLDGSMPTR